VEGPKWECDQSRYDFGTVYAGAIIRHPFEFRNVGHQVLKVLEAKPRCSCSVAENYTRVLKPGETGRIPFRLNTAHKDGFVDEWLAIKTNDPRRPIMTIRLNGVVKTVCRVEVISDAGATSASEIANLVKARGYFGKIKAHDHLKRVLRMTNQTERPLSLTMLPIRPSGSPFKASLREVRPGQTFELTLIGEPPFPPGATNAVITFKTNIVEKPIYTLPLSAYVPPRIEVMPPKIVADRNSTRFKLRHITITNNGKTPFKVTGVAVSSPAFKLAVQRADPAKPNQTVIEVTLPPGAYQPPPYGEVVRIETTDAEKPVIEVFVLPSLTRPPTPRPADKPLKLYPIAMPAG